MQPGTSMRRGDRGALLWVEVADDGYVVRTDPTETWHFDVDGRPRSLVRPDAEVAFRWVDGVLQGLEEQRSGRSIELGWDAAGERIEEIRVADGRVARYLYDEQGDCVTATTPDHGDRTYAYDGTLLRSITDADGIVEVSNEFDEDGRVLGQRTPFGRSIRYRYLAGYRTVVSDDDGGPINSFWHDRTGNLIRVQDGDGNDLQRFHDGRGLSAGWVDRSGARWDTEHDDDGRLVETHGPEGGSSARSGTIRRGSVASPPRLGRRTGPIGARSAPQCASRRPPAP